MATTDNPLQVVETLAFLGLVLLPVVGLAGGALFVPWRAEFWRLSTWPGRLRRNLVPLALLTATLGLDVLEAQFDPWITHRLGWDFTAAMASLDGALHEQLQTGLSSPFFRIPVAVCYVLGFPFLVFFTPFLYVWLGRTRTAVRAVCAYSVSLLLALPFYLFVPVDEVWTTGRGQNLAIFHPWVEAHLYAFNKVNNSFPSLHTCMSLVLAYVAWRAGPRRFARVAAVLAGVIVFSTVYLGIHWVADVVAGTLLAVGVVVLIEAFVPDDFPAAAADAAPATTGPAARPPFTRRAR